MTGLGVWGLGYSVPTEGKRVYIGNRVRFQPNGASTPPAGFFAHTSCWHCSRPRCAGPQVTVAPSNACPCGPPSLQISYVTIAGRFIRGEPLTGGSGSSSSTSPAGSTASAGSSADEEQQGGPGSGARRSGLLAKFAGLGYQQVWPGMQRVRLGSNMHSFHTASAPSRDANSTRAGGNGVVAT